jgi:hypothetical protein
MFDAPLKIWSLMRGFKPAWFIAGGWAIDLYLEKETRSHEDIEIAVFRRDQIALQNYLDGWMLKKAANGTLIEWNRGERLELPIHEIHCFSENCELPFLEVLLNETDGDEWLFRRNVKVTKPLSKLYLTSRLGMKFLRPEIVLLYKSKNPRPKDEQDFENVAKFLEVESKDWLGNALADCYSGHHWLHQKLMEKTNKL